MRWSRFVAFALIRMLVAAMPARPLKADTTQHLYLPLITHNDASATPMLPTQAALHCSSCTPRSQRWHKTMPTMMCSTTAIHPPGGWAAWAG
jgi:hypothetical protein